MRNINNKLKMKFYLFIFILFLTTINSNKTAKRILIESTLTKIKENASWNAYELHENPFKSLTKKQIKQMFGVQLTYTKITKPKLMMLLDSDDHYATFDVPENFDARNHWPECVSEIRQQEHCGSCWAFSASSTLSDRFCIASKGQIRTKLSPQYMLSCDNSNMACKGGLLDKAWKFLELSGTTKDSCTPYVSGDGIYVPKCNNSCDSKSIEKPIFYKVEKDSSKPLNCTLQIQRELMENGPVQTGFEVYEDFLHYKSGIYKYTDGIILGGHAVKIVGWGKEGAVNYWIVANSWGPEWGEKGYFRIAFGECTFEENAYVGLPDLKSIKTTTVRDFLK